MYLSIIILNYKKINLVRQQLRSLDELHLPFSYETIVVDNASGDRIETLSKEFPNVLALPLTWNCGMGAGNNTGLKRAQGEYVLILNPDVILLPRAIETLCEYLSKSPRVGMAGPKLLNPDQTLQYSCFRFPRWYTPFFRRTKLSHFSAGKSELDRFLMREWDHNDIRSVEWLQGSAFLVRRNALEEVGLFDERFFLFFEDTDWCRRFWQKHWEVAYVPDAVMVHYPQRLSSFDGIWTFFNRLTWIHISSWVKYFWKWRNQRLNPNDQFPMTN
ncbi:MAG: glycosyltransferase family 2 protein [Patescibacteria group bacterium]